MAREVIPNQYGFQCGMLSLQPGKHQRRRMRVICLANPRKSHGRRRLRGVQHLRQFMLAVLHRHRRDDDAKPRATQVHHKLFHAVGQLHYQHVVPLYALVQQLKTENINLSSQLCPCQSARPARCKVAAVGRVNHGFGIGLLTDIFNE